MISHYYLLLSLSIANYCEFSVVTVTSYGVLEYGSHRCLQPPRSQVVDILRSTIYDFFISLLSIAISPLSSLETKGPRT